MVFANVLTVKKKILGIRKKDKKVILIASFFIMFGLCINIYEYLYGLKFLLNKEIKQLAFKEKRIVYIFLINNVKRECNGDFLFFAASPKNIKRFFYVTKDFSDIEIDNFKQVFNLQRFKVMRMNKNWERIYKKLREKYNVDNFLIIYNKEGSKVFVRRI